ncbi:hypothetical protein D3C72_2175430 [compost metagenome]
MTRGSEGAGAADDCGEGVIGQGAGVGVQRGEIDPVGSTGEVADQVPGCACQTHVRQAAKDEGVVAGPADQAVLAGASRQPIIARAPGQCVVACSAIQLVVAGIAGQGIGQSIAGSVCGGGSG